MNLEKFYELFLELNTQAKEIFQYDDSLLKVHREFKRRKEEINDTIKNDFVLENEVGNGTKIRVEVNLGDINEDEFVKFVDNFTEDFFNGLCDIINKKYHTGKKLEKDVKNENPNLGERVEKPNVDKEPEYYVGSGFVDDRCSCKNCSNKSSECDKHSDNYNFTVFMKS